MEPKKMGNCNYHACKKRAEVVQCKHCKNFFCKDHVTPNVPNLPNFRRFGNAANMQIAEQWRKGNCHPCPDYVEYLEKQQKEEEIKYEMALKNATTPSKPHEQKAAELEKIRDEIEEYRDNKKTEKKSFWKKLKRKFR